MQVLAQRGVQGVLKHVRKFSSDFGESGKAVARRGSAQRVRGNVKTFEVLVLWRDVLQHANVFPQILQVLGRLLEEDFDGFALRSAHARPSVTNSGFNNSSAVGFR